MVIVPGGDFHVVYLARALLERAYFCDLLDTGEDEITPLVVMATLKGGTDERSIAGTRGERNRAREFGASGFARAA